MIMSIFESSFPVNRVAAGEIWIQMYVVWRCVNNNHSIISWYAVMTVGWWKEKNKNKVVFLCQSGLETQYIRERFFSVALLSCNWRVKNIVFFFAEFESLCSLAHTSAQLRGCSCTHACMQCTQQVHEKEREVLPKKAWVGEGGRKWKP